MLEEDSNATWIRDQISESIAEGITQSAKGDPPIRGDIAHSQATSDLAYRERSRREKYETSRPFSEQERVLLIRSGLREVFVTIPAVELAAIRYLRSLTSDSTSIVFSAPEEYEVADARSVHRIEMTEAQAKDLSERFERFSRELDL